MKLKKWIAAAVSVLALASLVSGCGSDKKGRPPGGKEDHHCRDHPRVFRTGHGSGKEGSGKTGLKVEIKTFSDYVTPDQALAQKDIDLNSFQHEPFLLAFNKKNGTKLVSIGKTYLAPLRLLALEAQEVLLDAGVDCSLTTGEGEDCRGGSQKGDRHLLLIHAGK